MNVFDILGPVMIGPSSSHTARCRKGSAVLQGLFLEPAVKADILLHGSLCKNI